jgi:putative membrane protein
MPRRDLRRTPLALLCAAALVAACAKGDKSADSARLADSAAAATATAAPAGAPAPAPALTDANILAVMDAANMADSSDGAVAATKGTNPDVKAFGRDMVKDHHELRKEGQDLAKKLNVTPALPPGDNSAAAAKAWHDSLVALPKGDTFDKAYIDHEVLAHQSVLATLQTASSATQTAELKSAIEKAAKKVQDHLDKAQTISQKLHGSGMGAPAGTDTTTKKP